MFASAAALGRAYVAVHTVSTEISSTRPETVERWAASRGLDLVQLLGGRRAYKRQLARRDRGLQLVGCPPHRGRSLGVPQGLGEAEGGDVDGGAVLMDWILKGYHVFTMGQRHTNHPPPRLTLWLMTVVPSSS